MKKWMVFMLTVLLFGVTVFQQAAQAAGTADNWSISLTFQTDQTTDLLPVTLGVGASARQVMKPPPMPGAAVTLNDADAIINAYVKSAGKKEAESLQLADAAKTGFVWPLEVNVEQKTAAVKVKVNLTELYSGYKVYLVAPKSGKRQQVTNSNDAYELFTSGADGSTEIVYVVAGTSSTFAAADAGSVVGAINIPSRDPETALGDVMVELKGTGKSATTNASGFFTMDSVSAGSYTVRVDGPHLLASEGTLTVDTDGNASLALTDPFACDADEDGTCDVSDFAWMKKCMNKLPTDEVTISGQPKKCADANFNSDDAIDVSDFASFKKGMGIDEPPR